MLAQIQDNSPSNLANLTQKTSLHGVHDSATTPDTPSPLYLPSMSSASPLLHLTLCHLKIVSVPSSPGLVKAEAIPGISCPYFTSFYSLRAIILEWCLLYTCYSLLFQVAYRLFKDLPNLLRFGMGDREYCGNELLCCSDSRWLSSPWSSLPQYFCAVKLCQMLVHTYMEELGGYTNNVPYESQQTEEQSSMSIAWGLSVFQEVKWVFTN